jgi:hypothetical protein
VPLWRSSARRSSRAAWCPGSSSSTGTAWPGSPAPAEIRSWERSLHTLSADLVQAGLDEVEVLVEYQLPLTSQRADVVLWGVHARIGQPSYVVIELKQWSAASLLEDSVDLCVVPAYGGARLHPGEQVRRYCGHLGDFLATLVDLEDPLAGVAYLHNATDRDVEELFRLTEDEQGRLFTGQRRAAFLDYLTTRLSPAPGAEAADQLMGSAVRPSRQLLALAADEVQRRERFRLQDQQQTAYRLVLRALERARRGVTKQAIVVVGGPGSGKSVIALSLLGELSRQGRTVLHATGSSAFTQTLRKVAGQRAPRVKAMFRYFNQFGELEPNELDVLLRVEAHRIRETSANRYTKASARTGTPQVDELLQVARVPVFLLDEHQVVRPGELGSLREIKAAAARLGIDVECVELDGQYRCGGSRAYETWVLRLLGFEPGGPMVWEGDEHFAVQLADSAEHMEAVLRRHQDADLSEASWNFSEVMLSWPDQLEEVLARPLREPVRSRKQAQRRLEPAEVDELVAEYRGGASMDSHDRVQWAGRWTHSQVESGRQRDRARKLAHHDAQPQDPGMTAGSGKPQEPGAGLLRRSLAKVFRLEAPTSSEVALVLFVYVDNSNLWIEGMRVSAVRKGLAGTPADAMTRGILDHDWSYDFGKLYQAICPETAQIGRSALFGSRPPANDSLWDMARREGFEVTTYDRNFSNHEKEVDVAISTLLMEDSYEHMKSDRDDRAVLVSGDRDYSPTVRSLSRRGLPTTVVFWKHATAKVLSEAAADSSNSIHSSTT